MRSRPQNARASSPCSIAPPSTPGPRPTPAQRLRWIGEAAEQLNELGEVEKARPLFAEGLRSPNQMKGETKGENEYRRAYFAAQLAPVDPPAALSIAKEFKGASVGGSYRVVLGLRMMDQDPAEALWFWKEMHGIRSVGINAVFARLPMGDLARAQRFFDQITRDKLDVVTLRFLRIPGLGSESSVTRPPRAGRSTRSCTAVDGLMQERPELLQLQTSNLLPIVERIDPRCRARGLLAIRGITAPLRQPEGAQRLLPDRSDPASRLVRPRGGRGRSSSRVETGSSIPRTASWRPGSSEFETWSSFDPRAAVARLEKIPVAPIRVRMTPGSASPPRSALSDRAASANDVARLSGRLGKSRRDEIVKLGASAPKWRRVQHGQRRQTSPFGGKMEHTGEPWLSRVRRVRRRTHGVPSS